ncbi:hypothetical protein ACFL5D_05515 [Candidatus Neomarinimicrobiota bacterium]
MPINIETPKISSAETPRKILAADFKSLGGELPIKGGWGYSKEGACIIDKNDPVVSKNLPFDGVGIEYIFVEKRIYEELIIFQSKDSKHSGIKWELIEQKLHTIDNKHYDQLRFKVTGFRDNDWNELKLEFESNEGFQNSDKKRLAHEKKRKEKMVYYNTEYWFDITSFFNKKVKKTKHDIIDSFFVNKKDFQWFLNSKDGILLANDGGTCFAKLEKEEKYWIYKLIWEEDGTYIGEYIAPFQATDEKLKIFNAGCKLFAEWMEIYIETGSYDHVPETPSAFGPLAYTDNK